MPDRPSLATALLTGGLWAQLATVHRDQALRHQYRQLVESGAIEAFEVAAGRTEVVPTVGPPTFISDSDVHKWLDAVARALPAGVPDDVRRDFDATIELLDAARDRDGYLNTWVQALFPDGRFEHLLTEHESYTTGHLVEAGVSLHEATGDDRLLRIALDAVAVLGAALGDPPHHREDGHEEIELALVRLHRATGDPQHLELARRWVERRGTQPHVRRQALADHLGTGRRLASQARRVRALRRDRPGWTPRPNLPLVDAAITPDVVRRTVGSFLSGRHWQNDRPARQLTEPTGHAVAFHYLQTALTMLAAELGDDELRAVTETAWEREVGEHLFVNGGVGAMTGLEGFGAPYDLDPERAYCETCASLSGVQWNRELGLLSGDARYDDLAEWQLLNGAAVGMGLDGTRWAYNNPLQAPPGFERRPWYPVPCCPANLTRTWVGAATLATSRHDGAVTVHQLMPCHTELGDTSVDIDGDVPWAGTVRITVHGELPSHLLVRIPSWTDAHRVDARLDGATLDLALDAPSGPRHTASGLAPHSARWARLDLRAVTGDRTVVELDLPTPIRLLRQDPRTPRSGGRVAIGRGPLLFCLEGVDHPWTTHDELVSLTVDPATLAVEAADDLLAGARAIGGRTPTGRPLRFVPYFLWGNRGPTGMTTFVSTTDHRRTGTTGAPR